MNENLFISILKNQGLIAAIVIFLLFWLKDIIKQYNKLVEKLNTNLAELTTILKDMKQIINENNKLLIQLNARLDDNERDKN